MKITAATAVVILGLLSCDVAHAQIRNLTVGDRVRVTTLSGVTAVGRLARADDSLLVLVTSEPTRMAPAVEYPITRHSIALLERSEGIGSGARKGAILGASLGVVAGVVVGYLSAMGTESNTPVYTLPPTFGVLGALTGAAIGSAAKGERWTTMPQDAPEPSPQSPGPHPSVNVGDRIRLTTVTAPASTIVGRVRAIDDSRFIIAVAPHADQAYGPRDTIEWNLITRLERSVGYRSASGKGALIGAGIGLLAGGAAILTAHGEEGMIALGAPVVFGSVGTIVGAAVGASHHDESWLLLSAKVPARVDSPTWNHAPSDSS